MKKMDEMEQAINQKGIKWSWAFLVLSLVLWSTYNYVKTQQSSLPSTLLGLQFVVYFLVTGIEKSKMGDHSGRKQLLPGLAVLLGLLMFGAILYFTLGR